MRKTYLVSGGAALAFAALTMQTTPVHAQTLISAGALRAPILSGIGSQAWFAELANQVVSNAAAGAVAGAVTTAVIGTPSAVAGAATGALAGAAYGAVTYAVTTGLDAMSTSSGSTSDGSTSDGSTSDGSTSDGSTSDGSTSDGSTSGNIVLLPAGAGAIINPGLYTTLPAFSAISLAASQALD